jgi:hypothetical protein
MSVIGFLLPLGLVAPISIYCRFACPARPPRTELDLFGFAVGVAVAGGIANLVPFGIYKSLSRSQVPAPATVAADFRDPRLIGIIGAGIALLGATATLHTAVLFDVFASQPVTMSRYAIGNIAIVVLEFGAAVVGYLVGWTSGSCSVVTRRWQKRRNWRIRRNSKSGTGT